MLDGNFSTIAGAGCQSSGKVTLKTPAPACRFRATDSPDGHRPVAAFNLASKYLPSAKRPANQCGLVTYGIPQTGDEQQWIERTDWV
jgi:hypothetical protein